MSDQYSKNDLAKALARTYGGERDGWERVEEYRKVMDYAAQHPSKGSQAIATSLELPRERIRPWLNGAKPDPARAVEVADTNKWLELEWTEAPFTALNILVSWVFAGGSINKTWVPSFTVDDQTDRDRLDRCFSRIGVGYTVRREDDASRATEVVPSDHASILGRVLHVLGAPHGSKSFTSQMDLPDYLSKAPFLVRLDFLRNYVLLRGTEREDRPQTPVQLREERPKSFKKSLKRLVSDVVGAEKSISGSDESAMMFLSQRSCAMLYEEPTFGTWTKRQQKHPGSPETE